MGGHTRPLSSRLALLIAALAILWPLAPTAVGVVQFDWYISGPQNSNSSCWQRGVASPSDSGVATPAIVSQACQAINLASHTYDATTYPGDALNPPRGGVGFDL